MSNDLGARYRRLTEAYRAGDIAAVKAELGWPEDFPNTVQPMELACGDRPIVSAIMFSPLRFVRGLLDLGAEVEFVAPDGFPTLFCAIDADRPDKIEVLGLLLRHGADPNQRGINDGTALHYAVWRRDLAAVAVLLEAGADSSLRTRIYDCSTALEDARNGGFNEAAALIEARG
jgi:ankyrin repeat protein